MEAGPEQIVQAEPRAGTRASAGADEIVRVALGVGARGFVEVEEPIAVDNELVLIGSRKKFQRSPPNLAVFIHWHFLPRRKGACQIYFEAAVRPTELAIRRDGW